MKTALILSTTIIPILSLASAGPIHHEAIASLMSNTPTGDPDFTLRATQLIRSLDPGQEHFISLGGSNAGGAVTQTPSTALLLHCSNTITK